jgi:hypothetical protein
MASLACPSASNLDTGIGEKLLTEVGEAVAGASVRATLPSCT